MNKQMREVAVRTTTEGKIEIAQDVGAGEEHYIDVHPEQVEMLVQWLHEAKEEIEGEMPAGELAINFLAGLPETLLSSDHPDYVAWRALKEKIDARKGRRTTG